MGLVSSGPPRDSTYAAVLGAAITAAAVALQPAALATLERFPLDEHAKASLDLALNLTLCHRAAVRSSAFAPARYVTEHPEALHLPPREIVARSGLSIDAYCGTLVEPETNNENSLMLIETTAWWFRPSLTVDGIARALIWFRIAHVALFAWACLEAGVSALLTVLAVCGAIAVFRDVSFYQYTLYPFLATVPLAWTAVCSLIYRRMESVAPWRAVGLSMLAGVIAAFGINLRTSYTPLFVGLFVLTVVASLRRGGVLTSRRPAVAALAAFAIGAWAFGQLVMKPLEHPAGAGTVNYTYHTVSHPLVMALAVPPNPLSRSEGIQWNDMNNWEIAKRIKPDVSYLGPDYEGTLYRYYFGLWRARPWDMVTTYWIKLLRTGRGVFLVASDLVPQSRWLRKVYLVWADRVNGAELLLAATAMTAGSLFVLWRTGSAVAFIASCLATATVLLLLESSLIYSEFFPAYHSYLLYVVLMAPAALAQAMWDFAGAWPTAR